MSYIKPLFRERKVPDDEILLAEALAQVNAMNAIAVRGVRKLWGDDNSPDGYCVLGILGVSRYRDCTRITYERLPGAADGNDGIEVRSLNSDSYDPFYMLGHAYYEAAPKS